ncbi:KH domain-containing protein [Striga hermonthica]|uniref:KH domain-containing protein n=1 Tax=Striga hermonthica TaxID=68872 RepID=A0A9N7RCN0_STRHE|nr:KH domain-containing protein [Striga hermonthica]
MTDEVAYGVAGGELNKRKYEDSPSPVARRATGFSSPPDSAPPPSSYNSVPPPMNEIEAAKQKAQEIAARLLNNADPSKRARVENGAGVGGGFDAIDAGSGQKHPGLGLSGPPPSASFGYPGPSKKIEIPNGRVGVIIGKGGETIKYLQTQSGAKIQVTRDMDADPNAATRAVELTGTQDQIDRAEKLINDILSEADTGGSGIVSRRVGGQGAGADQFVLKVPNNKVGLVIGKGGETIKNMQARTGARIQVIPLHLPPGDMSKERTVQIDGTKEQIEAARQLVEEVISENRMRNQSMGGGYNSQQDYQARPPSNWSQPGPPMQQPGYGYVQPGPYPGPEQYNMNNPNYTSYPPTSGGYTAGWDPSQNQQTAQGGSNYDYYSQQQQTHGGPADGSGYNYGQGQGQGQGYGQDGYGGYHTGTAQSGYGQPAANPSAGYEQQKPGGYNATYGNPPADGNTQTDTSQPPAQPSPNPNYPSGYGASSQSGYGTQMPSGYGSYGGPQAQKPGGGQPSYGQLPGSQGGSYAPSGYPPPQHPPPAQTGYAQMDAGAQRPPTSGYPQSQVGYGGPSYGGQPGYGQQPYGGGYSQQAPPAYSTDASAGAQPAQPAAGSAKTSPPS